MVELILNILAKVVTERLYWNVGILVNALQFLNADEKLITWVLYLNNSFGTLTNDKHALNVELNIDTLGELSNKLFGIVVIPVNEKVSTNYD